MVFIMSCDNTFHNFLFISKRMVKCEIYDCYITLQGCTVVIHARAKFREIREEEGRLVDR